MYVAVIRNFLTSSNKVNVVIFMLLAIVMEATIHLNCEYSQILNQTRRQQL